MPTNLDFYFFFYFFFLSGGILYVFYIFSDGIFLKQKWDSLDLEILISALAKAFNKKAGFVTF